MKYITFSIHHQCCSTCFKEQFHNFGSGTIQRLRESTMALTEVFAFPVLLYWRAFLLFNHLQVSSTSSLSLPKLNNKSFFLLLLPFGFNIWETQAISIKKEKGITVWDWAVSAVDQGPYEAIIVRLSLFFTSGDFCFSTYSSTNSTEFMSLQLLKRIGWDAGGHKKITPGIH